MTATEQVVETIRSLYRALGDRPAFDAHLDPTITIWESDAEGLLSLAELDGLRDARRESGSGPAPEWVRPEEFRVEVWEQTAVARFVLRVRQQPEDSTFRVTDVLRHADGRWRIVHHHAEKRS